MSRSFGFAAFGLFLGVFSLSSANGQGPSSQTYGTPQASSQSPTAGCTYCPFPTGYCPFPTGYCALPAGNCGGGMASPQSASPQSPYAMPRTPTQQVYTAVPYTVTPLASCYLNAPASPQSATPQSTYSVPSKAVH